LSTSVCPGGSPNDIVVTPSFFSRTTNGVPNLSTFDSKLTSVDHLEASVTFAYKRFEVTRL
jgi:hypothetical protein